MVKCWKSLVLFDDIETFRNLFPEDLAVLDK